MGYQFDSIVARQKKRKRGHPGRWFGERMRTILWSAGVQHFAGVDFEELEEILGDDGRMNGLWSRYKNGHVSPRPERVRRIDAILPGTARYFDCPIWSLLENRRYTRDELDDAIRWLPPQFRKRFAPIDVPEFGSRWVVPENVEDMLTNEANVVGELEFGLDALTSLLIRLREAEYLEDEALYFCCAQGLSVASSYLPWNPILSYLNEDALNFVVKPLQVRLFASEDLNEFWQNKVERFVKAKGLKDSNFNVLECLRYSE